MSRRPLVQFSRLLCATLVAACAPGDTPVAPDTEARTSTGVVNEDAVYTVCGVPMRVQTVGKIKPIFTPVNGVIAFPQTTVRLTNTLTGTSLVENSSGTVMLRTLNGIRVAELHGRNVLVNTSKGTADLFVGVFVERVIAPNEAVYEGTGQRYNLCSRLVP